VDVAYFNIVCHHTHGGTVATNTASQLNLELLNTNKGVAAKFMLPRGVKFEGKKPGLSVQNTKNVLRSYHSFISATLQD
jgi:hypothetical protein